MKEEDFQKIDSMLARHIGGLAESVNHRLDDLIHGQHALLRKLDLMEIDLCQRLERIAHKLELIIAQPGATPAKNSTRKHIPPSMA